MPRAVLEEYGIEENMLRIIPFGNGLINNTWKIELPGREFILQRINTEVFKDPQKIAGNIRRIGDYLKTSYPEYTFVSPIPNKEGRDMIKSNGAEKDAGYYRLFPFVPGSHTSDVVLTPELAFEAASQFGRFTRLLAGFNPSLLSTTIPKFHDLGYRYDQFREAIKKGNRRRILEAETLIKTLTKHADIVKEYRRIMDDPGFRLRVTHHDTKISNVLFDANDKGICVIDLDTVMPGYFISDVGDMMRTYLSPVSEEEQDFDKIIVRPEFYKAIVGGYFSEMKDVLTETERNYFVYAGKFMIYMQAVRFLTDHLYNDTYYKVSYPRQNYVRAANQADLLKKLCWLEKEKALN
ncbi:MAG: aminoglycoside phosphotransferase family protein [Chitinophagaceae bacterium]|nr:MAG: aminoglycoside phosphotransferase family protein [Chitinophagaceae bacterium]